MNIEETIAAAVAAQVQPLIEEQRRVAAAIDALRRALPPLLVAPAQAAKALGMSIPTVRRRIKDGSLPSCKVGGKRLVDLAAVRPPTEAEVIRLAAVAKVGS